MGPAFQNPLIVTSFTLAQLWLQGDLLSGPSIKCIHRILIQKDLIIRKDTGEMSSSCCLYLPQYLMFTNQKRVLFWCYSIDGGGGGEVRFFSLLQLSSTFLATCSTGYWVEIFAYQRGAHLLMNSHYSSLLPQYAQCVQSSLVLLSYSGPVSDASSIREKIP